MAATSIRRVLMWISTGLIVVAVLAALGLLLTGAHSRKLGAVQVDAVESIRAAEEIEIALLLAQRAERLRETPEALPEPHWPEVERWLAIAQRHTSTPEEIQLVHQLATEVALVRQRWAEAGPEVEPEEQLRADLALARTLPTVEALADLNVAQAAEAHASASRWTHVAEVGGLVLATALLGAVGIGLWAVQTMVYRPIEQVRATIRQFGQGDLSARVSVEHQPAEIREVAQAFNDMADALGRQREMQLALVAGVAHDLRNPLFALQLVGAAALRSEAATERERRLAEQVVGQLRAVNRMLEDLVEASRIEAGHLDIRPAPADLVRLVQDCVRLYGGTSPRHEVVVVDPPAELHAEVDATRISQVLANLLSNAIKYSPDGGPVEVALEDLGGDVGIRVSDQGMGISPEHRSALFEPFRRAGGVGDVAGTGLGLSVCKRIVELHGGTIAIDSEPGRGTTVRIRMPRQQARESLTPELEARPIPQA